MRVMDDAPERTGRCLQRLFVLPVISSAPVLSVSPPFVNNRPPNQSSHHSIRSKSKRQITGRETKSMRVMDDAPERTGRCLQRLFVLPVISSAPVLSVSPPFVNNRPPNQSSHHSIRSKSKRQITGRETKSMRVMDDAPERTGKCLQRLFVLPVISPVPVLSIPPSLLTTDSGAEHSPSI